MNDDLKVITTREERILIANQIIEEIALRGRQFLRCKTTGKFGYFALEGDIRKRVWFYDKNGRRINPFISSRSEHFSEGGTLWSLVQDFAFYIRTGEHTNGMHGYGGLNSSHWGYSPEDMTAITELANKLGYLRN